MAIRPGEMRHRIRIERQSTAVDAAGEPLRVWALVAERWASVEPLVGKEFFASQQRSGTVKTRFRLRFLAGVAPKMRIVWNNKVFDISDVLMVDGIEHELVIMADESVGEKP